MPQSIVSTGSFGFVLSVIMLLLGVLFCLLRACNLCGGWYPSRGLCRGEAFDFDEGDGYSKGQWLSAVLCVVFAALIVRYVDYHHC